MRVVDQLLEVNALYRLRAAQGILGLRKKYSDTRLEAACAKALTVGDPSYRTIQGILIAGTETDPEPETGDAGAAAFLHGPEGLFPTDIPTQTLGFPVKSGGVASDIGRRPGGDHRS